MGPTGVNGLAAGGGGPVYWAQSHSLSEEKQKPELKLGAILNTIQSPLLPLFPTNTSRIHTDIPTSPPSGLRNGPTYVALVLWLNGPSCKWSGVEWTLMHYIFRILETADTAYLLAYRLLLIYPRHQKCDFRWGFARLLIGRSDWSDDPLTKDNQVIGPVR